MLIGTGLSHNLWAKAVNHSIWIRNREPSRASPEFKLPIEKATTCKPDLRGLLEWGTQVWVKNLQAGKLDPQAKEGCFVGYNNKSKGYCVYWPGKNRVSVERNVYINKKAILEPRVIRFEEEWEPDKQAIKSNPIILNKSDEQSIIPKQDHAPDNPTITPDTQSSALPDPNLTPKRQRNSLAGLPQFDKDTHGHGKCRATIKGANLFKGEGLELGGVKWEPNKTKMDWFIKALQMAMAAISDDEPELEEAINSNESDS